MTCHVRVRVCALVRVWMCACARVRVWMCASGRYAGQVQCFFLCLLGSGRPLSHLRFSLGGLVLCPLGRSERGRVVL